MHHNRNNFFDTRIIISFSIIAAGIILLADNLGADLQINLWEWWPLVLVFIGLGQLFQPAQQRQPLSGFIFISIGFVILGNNLDYFNFDLGDLWPVILIIVGLSMIRRHSWKKDNEISDQDLINLSMILGGGEYRFSSKKFKGGKVTSIMGGGTLDLTDAEMETDEVTIDVFALMGGMEIRIPKHWLLNTQTTPIMGGIENKTYHAHSQADGLDLPQTGKRLTIVGTIIMGGLEVRN